ncbi:hypothetical protein HIM_09909 [Hirsutella minnesotensis 3608]|uniref:Protein kinase domain-containing protein n=1 Tax=Hirsutella minnesotensis 3608 TaxID=1043627 RepID=A0A0F7ZKP7_9HYPO|nr:hypothetical protein HIM_09909 [Hirsutella minnesotensis 3608]
MAPAGDKDTKHQTYFPFNELDNLYVLKPSPEAKPLFTPSGLGLPTPAQPETPRLDQEDAKRKGVKPGVKASPEAKVKSEATPADIVETRSDQPRAAPYPPWDYLFNLELGVSRRFVVAQSRSKLPGHFLIQKLSLPQLRRIQLVKHQSFVQPVHTVALGQSYLIAWPFMPMSLLEVANNRLLDDVKCAAILGQVSHPCPDRDLAAKTLMGLQVIQGLRHLYSQGLEHGQICCSNILINFDGFVKISGHEECRDLSQDGDIPGLIRLIMELVNGYYKQDSNPGINNPDMLDKIPLTCDFLAFLSPLRPDAMNDLDEHPLLKLAWSPKALAGMISQVLYFNSWTAGYPASIDDL